VIGVLRAWIFLITGTIERADRRTAFQFNPALVGWLPTAVIGLCKLVANLKNALGGYLGTVEFDTSSRGLRLSR